MFVTENDPVSVIFIIVCFVLIISLASYGFSQLIGSRKTRAHRPYKVTACRFFKSDAGCRFGHRCTHAHPHKDPSKRGCCCICGRRFPSDGTTTFKGKLRTCTKCRDQKPHPEDAGFQVAKPKQPKQPKPAKAVEPKQPKPAEAVKAVSG